MAQALAGSQNRGNKNKQIKIEIYLLPCDFMSYLTNTTNKCYNLRL